MSVSAPYGDLVAQQGLGGSHRLILDEVRDGSRVLDVGCATGYVAAELSARGCEVVGLEPNPLSAAQAERHCERVIVGSVESADDRALIPGSFDFVIFGDVLEHLMDPWEALRSTRGLLSPGGVAVVSLPNVAAWPVRLRLLAGSFEYRDFGLLDRTHLRFFTRASAHALVERAGFAIERERFVHLEREPGALGRAFPLPASLLRRALVRLRPGLFAQQFVLRLRPLERA
jgi:SAM-dependent methyltransferase